MKKMQVWWIPQVPMKAFTVNVKDVAEAVKIMDTLAEYDIFQYDNKIKPDYSNAGGLNVFDESDDTDGPDGSWVSWDIELEDGQYFDDPREYLIYQTESA